QGDLRVETLAVRLEGAAINRQFLRATSRGRGPEVALVVDGAQQGQPDGVIEAQVDRAVDEGVRVRLQELPPCGVFGIVLLVVAIGRRAELLRVEQRGTLPEAAEDVLGGPV